MTSYTGEYIWIIGASSGIGAALARELSAQGALLALSARRKDKLNEVVVTCQGQGHQVVTMDSGDALSVQKAFVEIVTIFPRIDRIIFLSAIYSAHDGKPKPLDFVYDMVRVNFLSAYNIIEYAQPYFEQQGFGQLALCASVAGYRGLPQGQPYCATKAALISLAESLKLEWEQKNMDVKIINPGFVKTPLTDKNRFPMPMMITAEKAAIHIARGLKKKRFEITFPWAFSLIMKTLRLMPDGLYFTVAGFMQRHMNKE